MMPSKMLSSSLGFKAVYETIGTDNICIQLTSKKHHVTET